MARNFRKPVVSMRGTVIDMDAMRAANEDSRAVGTSKMNARGDVLGQGGEIEIRREKIVRDYYARNPSAATQVSLKPAIPDTFESPDEVMARLTNSRASEEMDAPQGIASKKTRRLLDSGED